MKLALTVNTWSVSLKRYKDVGGLDVVLATKFHNNRVIEKRGFVGTERRVCSDNDAFASTELNELLLGTRTRPKSGFSVLNQLNIHRLTDGARSG
jgi:hypothetical protein